MKYIYKAFAWYFRTIARILIIIHQPRIVGITGSVGKTTTKDVTLALLEGCTQARGSIRSQNSDLTTPLSVLGLEVQNKERRPWVWLYLILRAFFAIFSVRFPRVLVLELGAGAPGDIHSQVRWLQPNVGVFTALSKNPVHVEFFDGKEELYNEKKLLATYTKKSGCIIYPDDDEILKRVLDPFIDRSVTIPGFDSSVREIRYTAQGTHAQVHHHDRWLSVDIPGVWSQSIIDSYRLGLEVVTALGYDIDEAIAGFAFRYLPPPGRARVLHGIRGSVIIDDSYNASPIAVTSALYTLEAVDAPRRKIFVFGDMKELGEYTEDAHKDVGKHAASFVDILITVGESARITHLSALKSGLDKEQAIHFEDSKQAGAWLKEHIEHQDYILAKASRHSIRMEQALVKVVLEDEKKYLVQEYL